MDAALAKKGFPVRPTLPPIPMPQARPMTDRFGIIDVPRFDPELGNYPAGRAPTINRTPLRGMPTPMDRVATRFAPDYSVSQYEDDVPPRQMGFSPPPMPFPSLNFEDAPGAALDAARAAPGAVVDAVRAAPRFVGEVAPAVGNALWQGSGIPALMRNAAGGPGSSRETVGEGDLAYMMGDDSRARDIYRQVEGEALGTTANVALTAIGAGGVIRGAQALRAGEGLLDSAAAFNAASKVPGMALPTYAAIGATTAAPFIAGQASAQGIDPALAIEDRYVREALEGGATRVPSRPNEQSARAAGFMQGVLLDNWDDNQRNPAKIAERDRLRAEWDATPKEQRTGEQAARLMNAEQDADPVGVQARANRQAFNDARTQGEVTTGAGTVVLSTGLGALIRNQPLANALFGFGKGAAYGWGSGEGDVPEDERGYNAIKDAAISTGVSALAVPAFKAGAKAANELPITLKERGIKIPGMTGDSRFFAPSRLKLKDGISADEAANLAFDSDAQRKPRLFAQPKIMPRLDALIDASPEGRARQVEITKQPVIDAANDAGIMRPPVLNAPISDTAEAVSRRLLDPGNAGIKAWRSLSEDQQNMAAEALRQRLARGDFGPNEQAVLRSKAGLFRMQELGLVSLGERHGNWSELIPDQMTFDKPAPVNRWWHGIADEKVVPRLNPDTARALAEARMNPRDLPARGENEPYQAGTFALKDLFDSEKTPGRRPLGQRPSATEKATDLLTKAGALAFAIPATGAIDKALVEPWLDERFGFPPERSPVAPPMPLIADEELRRDLATLGLNADLAQSQATLSGVESDFEKERDLDVKTAQAAADELARTVQRLQSTPPEIPVEQPDGSTLFVSNKAARARALEKATELLPSLRAARDKVQTLTTNRPADKAQRALAASQKVGALQSDAQALQGQR